MFFKESHQDRLPYISASLLAADLGRLAEECAEAESAGADWLHWDIMDGSFVPHISFGSDTLKSVQKGASASVSLPFDVHLMVRHPEKHFQRFQKAGASVLTFHPESTEEDPVALLDSLEGVYKGLAVTPGQDPLEWPEAWWQKADLALMMTVQPGLCGQSFMHSQLFFVSALRMRFPHLCISIDGGINTQTAPLAVEAGADILVTGSCLFSSKDYAETIASLKGNKNMKNENKK